MGSAFVANFNSSQLLHAAFTAVWLALVAQAFGVVGGFLLAPFRMARRRSLRSVAALYLWVFRGTPELLQLIAWYAVLPLAGVNLSLPVIAIIGLGANEVARMTEIVRAGLLSVDTGQVDASKVLGLNRLQTAWHVELPQAFRLIVPPIGNEINIMFKTTSLVSVIGISEILRVSQQNAETSRSPLGVYLAALVYYLIITTLWGAVQGFLEARSTHGKAGRGWVSVWWGGLTGNIAQEG